MPSSPRARRITASLALAPIAFISRIIASASAVEEEEEAPVADSVDEAAALSATTPLSKAIASRRSTAAATSIVCARRCIWRSAFASKSLWGTIGEGCLKTGRTSLL